jgi:hypothetical protein
MNLRRRLRGYYSECGFGFEKAGDFAFRDGACPYYQARAIFQLQEQGEEFWGWLVGHFRDVWW